ncbi:hypothetical protein N0V88_006609 [Collariella sp. IMI 366227]|nr:hypothetical protein N0V88_006609 [Collariella sp. IMI 366227]
MVSPKVAEALARARQEAPALIDGYQSLIEAIKTNPSPNTLTADLRAVVDALFADQLGIIKTRDLIILLIDTIRTLQNPDLSISLGSYLVTLMITSTHSALLLEQTMAIREMIAAAHEANEDFLDAAKALAEIPIETSQLRVSDAEKAAVWIRIVRNYLEVDDSTSAEAYHNKLKNVMHNVDDPELGLHFRLSAGRIQDSNRQFLVACKTYHDLSFSPVIAEEERLHTLSMAIKCAILAPAGPARSRALGLLYKDERSAGLVEEHSILEKMFFDRLLSPAEVDNFAQGLMPHQLAKTADGSTVLAKAVVEHNLLSASRLYSNIGFDELGLLLGLDGNKAEDTTARMIEQGRLSGSIDQIDRIIWFEGGEASGRRGEMRRWDGNVQALAEDVERLTDALQAEFPEFVATQIAV